MSDSRARKRLRRLHVPGGLHYVILHANEGRELFGDESDYASFIKLVERSTRTCRTRVYAFSWTPREVHFALQVTEEPLGRLMQRLAGQHARYMNRKLNQHGHLFQQRYWAALLEQNSLLPEVVRYIHLTPVRRGLVSDPSEYAWTSHHVYLGYANLSWITTGTVFRSLETSGRYRRMAYRQYMQEGLALLESGATARVASEPAGRCEDAEFLAQIAPRRRRRSDPVLLDRIINSVCLKLDIPREQMLSPSRRHNLSLARALVTWHATHAEVATLTQVAQHFQRNPSSLCVGVERYRRQRRDLFEEPIEELLGSEIDHAESKCTPTDSDIRKEASPP